MQSMKLEFVKLLLQILEGPISLINLEDLVAELKYLLSFDLETLPKNVWTLAANQEFYNNDPVQLDNESKVLPFCYFQGPIAIFPGSQVGPFSFLRPGTIIGSNSKVGHATEVKESIVSSNVSIAHRAYIGNSIIGTNSMIGAAFTSAVHNHNHQPIKIRDNTSQKVVLHTDLKKLGAIVEENAWIGCNVLTMPGTLVRKNTSIKPFNSYGGSIGKLIS